jgi:hypothetical protein
LESWREYMRRKTRKRLIRILAALVAGSLILVIVGLTVADRFEPLVREKTLAYIEGKFNCRASIDSLRIRFTRRSWLDLMLRRGRGASARVVGEGLSLHMRDKRGTLPLLALRKFSFEVGLDSVLQPPVRVPLLKLEGLELNIPPKNERPAILASGPAAAPGPPSASDEQSIPVLIDEIIADGSSLTMLPGKPDKAPLQFRIHRLSLAGAGLGAAMGYNAEVSNAKPPGLIRCRGSFGPWNSAAAADTPISGRYTFEKANLGVFKGIGGTLSSSGKFQGVLQEITVDGEARVPDFRLQSVQNRIPLETRFHATVDGTNGDTRLQPVEARLGGTRFTVKGRVVRNAGDAGKTVDMTAVMPDGRLQDVLLLAVRGEQPFMRGGVNARCRVTVPPGKQAVADKLELEGDFVLTGAEFTTPKVREAIADMSRRAQGKPTATDITEVPVRMQSRFQMASGVMLFQDLWFEIPGAKIRLEGTYDLGKEEIDMAGKTWIQARVSQMVKSTWKRWVLKPVDPFFAKEGYGTVTTVKISGTYSNPRFSR